MKKKFETLEPRTVLSGITLFGMGVSLEPLKATKSGTVEKIFSVVGTMGDDKFEIVGEAEDSESYSVDGREGFDVLMLRSLKSSEAKLTNKKLTLPTEDGGNFEVSFENLEHVEFEDRTLNLAHPSCFGRSASLVNASFDNDGITPLNSYVIVDDDEIEGWQSTTNEMEIWGDTYNGVDAYDGDYFAELNANVPGTLFQDLETVPGETLSWSFAHRGRAGEDTIALMIGTDAELVEQDQFTTGNTEWQVYEGIYIVPDGQTTTRFAWQSVSAAGGASIGNFLDAVQFGIPETCTEDTDLLGIAADYNVFVFEDMVVQNSDAGGKVAVGRDAKLQSYGVATGAEVSATEDASLVVGRDLEIMDGQVHYGKAAVGRTITTTRAHVVDGIFTRGTPINFESAQKHLLQQSADISKLAATDATTIEPWGAVKMTAENGEVDRVVFELSAADLEKATSLDIVADEGDTVIVNVSGEEVLAENFQMKINGKALQVGDAKPIDVLFNFHEATQLESQSLSWQGTLLAPLATFTFNNGHVNGQTIVKSLIGTGEFHNFAFGTRP